MPGPVPLGLVEFLDSATAGATVRERQRRALAGARLADRIGYTRVWVPEHHAAGSPSTNPLPLAAVLGSHTERIRVGGAVSLVRIRDPHLTAEDIVTAGLFCGDRLDVGLGRGDVGGDAARALPRKDDAACADAVAAIIAALDGRCAWIDPLDAPYQRWLHGAGGRSAAQAADLGFGYCHGLFLNPDLDTCLAALDRHRTGRPDGRRAVAIAVVAHPDPDRARADAGAQRGFQVARAGRPEECAGTVVELLDRTGADEVVIAELTQDTAGHLAALAAVHEHVAAMTAVATVGASR